MTDVMGIVNVTPDSFSDGGLYLAPAAAIAHGVQLDEEGADILDVGGESTRPGAEPVSTADEIRRVMPVIEGLMDAGVAAQISIDTSKAEVATEALAAGATMVNDVTALSDSAMAVACVRGKASLVLMHMRGAPQTMQDEPVYDDVVADVRTYLAAAVASAVEEGVSEEMILVDPGIGFGKTVEHNLELIDRLGELRDLGRPVVLGASRKSFLGKLTGRGPSERLGGSLAAATLGLARGADVLRVHDIGATVDAVRVAEAIVGRGEGERTAQAGGGSS